MMVAAPRPITTLLIANRGEIALRIMRTARQMGLDVVAVFSDADANALHVRQADRAIRIGPAPARDSYLNIAAIIAAAQTAGADAIHPGYGFLAENADFARACAVAGLVFVGPPASAIAVMGDKGRARALAVAAGIAVVPGFDGAGQAPDLLVGAARDIGYPVLLKPSVGGGGKGMHVVACEADFADTLAKARREAEAAFGDATMIVEKYLAAARHIEVQIFADHAGHVVHLFERDCSVQRRHQKVIEEAPAPELPAAMIGKMRAAAISCARACGYVGAGTVEFLVAGNQFYFMEMNTRLQVEHPVTEAVTGLDLVEWQLRVAMGEDLPLAQDQIRLTGHAIEARLCAEDAANGYLPQAGHLAHLRLPEGLAGIRVDSGVRQGSEIPVHYDSLIAKIISHGTTRRQALQRLSRALSATEVVGIRSNRALLAAVLAHDAFAAGAVDTDFLARYASDLAGKSGDPTPQTLMLAAFAAQRRAEWRAAAPDPADPHSPWMLTTGWRLGGRAGQSLHLQLNGSTHLVHIAYQPDGYAITIGGQTLTLLGTLADDGAIVARIGDTSLHAQAVFQGSALTLFIGGQEYVLDLLDPYQPPENRAVAAGLLTAPMPGIVVAVAVAVGQSVAKASILVVIEAMKMEHALTAPRDGIVVALNVKLGDRVAAGEELVVLEVLQ